MEKIIFLYVTLGLFASMSGFELSDHFQICSTENKECLNVAIEKAIKILCEKGLPYLKIPKLDPIEITAFSIGTKGAAVDIQQKYNNIKVVGFKDSKVSNSVFSKDKKMLTFTTTAPKFEQISDYDIKGRILIFPLFGNGKAVLTQYNTSVKHDIHFEEEQKGQDTFWKVKNYTVDMQPAKISFSFENLFNGNKVLSDRLHMVVNENWDVLWTDSKKDYEETYSRIYHGLAQKLFQQIPINKIFKV